MSVPEPVTVEFELTPEEWVDVSMQHAATQPQLVKAVRNMRIAFALLMLALAALFFLGGMPMAGYVFLIAALFMSATLGPMIRSSQRKRTLDYARTGIANGMFGPHRVELRPEGMLDVTDGYEWLTRWSAIERVEEGEAAFLVYTGPNSLLPIPHSAFRDSESLRRFSHAFFALREQDATKRVGGGASEGGAPDRDPL
ncbi:MAG: YcxB family protein [Gemmatimonadota bacterium]